MSKYILMDGGIIDASTDSEFIDKLRTGSKFESDLSEDEFLQNFISRLKLQFGADIKITQENKYENIVLELKKCGYLTKK